MVSVTARAVDGKANEATVKALAAALGLRRADLALRTGATARNKIFSVPHPPADLAERVRVLLERDPSG